MPLSATVLNRAAISLVLAMLAFAIFAVFRSSQDPAQATAFELHKREVCERAGYPQDPAKPADCPINFL